MYPERVGRYELIRHLATGGMARVYLARATGLAGFARHVVIKAVAPERGDQYVDMFLDEARLAAMLHHQHIAQVFEVGRADDGTYFLVMEYVHGVNVRSLLEAARDRAVTLPLDIGVSVTCAAAAGLHHAHECCALDGTPLGIVHRDVSPSNVIVGFDGAIKLIDFGIAKANERSSHTVTGFIKGKTGYMAPEQARGYVVDRRSDVFALGVLAYELTTQKRAFHGSSQFETMHKTIRGEVVPPTHLVPGYPPELEDVVMTALEVDPDDRFQDAEAMRQALDHVARELGLVVGATPVIRALDELFPGRREPWLAGPDVIVDEAPSEPQIIISAGAPRLARGTEPPVEELAMARGSGPIDDAGARPDLVTGPVELANAAIELTTGPADLITAPFERELPPPAAGHGSAMLPLPPPPVSETTPISEHTPIPEDLPVRDDDPAPERIVDGGSIPFAAIALRKPPRSMRAVAIGGAVLAGGFVLAMIVARQAASDAPQPPPPAPAPVVTPAPAPAPAPPPPVPTDVQLHVTTEPAGATVVLDGVRLGTAPFASRVPIKHGTAWLKVRLHGHIAVRTKVSLEHDVDWHVVLRPLSKN